MERITENWRDFSYFHCSKKLNLDVYDFLLPNWWNVFFQEMAANFQSTPTFVFYRNKFQEDFIVDLKEIRFSIPKMWKWKGECGDSMFDGCVFSWPRIIRRMNWIFEEMFACIKIKRMLHHLARALQLFQHLNSPNPD